MTDPRTAFLHLLDLEADEQDRLDREELYARHAQVSAAEASSIARPAPAGANRDQVETPPAPSRSAA